MNPRPPARVRVTNPRMSALPRPPVRSATREIDEQTGLGEVYMRSLVRQQLRLGLGLLAVLVMVVGSLPLLFTLEPRSARIHLLGLPLPWLIIGVGVYPLLALAAAWQVHAAEHAERDFAEILQRR